MCVICFKQAPTPPVEDNNVAAEDSPDIDMNLPTSTETVHDESATSDHVETPQLAPPVIIENIHNKYNYLPDSKVASCKICSYTAVGKHALKNMRDHITMHLGELICVHLILHHIFFICLNTVET